MRFAVAHKTATYLMVMCSYLAMVAGGGVSPVIALGGLGALILSWWWEPPLIRFEKWSWLWTTMSIFALLYSILTATVTGDFLGIGSEFLVWLIVAKAYNRRAARDWQQMYLLAFLMLVAGSVLNPDLTYGVCFLGFVIAATWALTLFHLRREMEDNLLVKHAADRASERVEVRRILDSRRIVGGRFFVGTGLLSLGVFLGSVAVFLALPRVGVGFFLKSRGGLTLTGFSDGVKLGGHGVIKNDPTVVMRVEVDASVGGRDAPPIHWRGVAFDHYRGGQWTRSQRAPLSSTAIEPHQTGDQRWLAFPHRVRDGDVKQDVWLEPLDSNVLFAASLPRMVEYVHTLRPRPMLNEQNDEVRLEHGSTVHYTAWSDVRAPSPEVLRAASGTVAPVYEVYLQLPPEITARTKQLAVAITKDQPTTYDKAMAIQRWLVANLSYTLELADPGRQEPVDFFLFDRKKGHCEYFASAFAVLARSVGIPVRQVNGFLGGEWNEYQSYVAVRAGDAHSWDEVYFPGVGWVTFDPTPPGEDALGRGGTGWTARLGRFLDTLRFQWSKWVIEYDLASQLSLFKSIGRGLESAASAVKSFAIAAKDAAVRAWPITLGLVLAIATLIVMRRRRRREGILPHARAKPRTRTHIAQAYDEVVRALAKAGVAREASITPRELASRIAARGEPYAPEVGELTELYYAAEWGGRTGGVAEARASALAVEIRRAVAVARRASR